MEKSGYPGVDYSGHGIAGNNENTLPQKDWNEAVDLLRQCEKTAEDIALKVQAGEDGDKILQEIGPLSRQLKEDITRLCSTMGHI